MRSRLGGRRALAGLLTFCLLMLALHGHTDGQGHVRGAVLATSDVHCPVCLALHGGMEAPPAPVVLPSLDAPPIPVAPAIRSSLLPGQPPALAVRGPPRQPAV